MPTLSVKSLWGIILALFVLLVIGQGYLFYKISAQGRSGTAMAGVGAEDSVLIRTPGSEGVSSGVNLTTVYGTVQSSAGGEVVVSMDGEAKTFAVNSSTRILLQGADLTSQSFQKELDAYNAQYRELLKDPEANREKIAQLAFPFTFKTTALALSDIRAGDSVTATVAKDSNVAVRIVKLSAPLTQ